MEEKNLVGYRFSPTGEELINYYLKNKILGKSWLVDEAIKEINICGYKPEFLPSLSKLESKDLVWYFCSPREFLPTKKKLKKTVTKRTTPFGFWKPTGVDRIIRDKRGNGDAIGIKKTLVYYEGKAAKGVRTPWVMHEYHITCLPLVNQRTYVICQVMYKGEDGDSFYGNNSNQPSHSSVSDLNTVTSPEVEQPGEEGFNSLSMNDLSIQLDEQENLSPCDGFDPDTLFSDNPNLYVQPQTPCDDNVCLNKRFLTQENRNKHRPKKPLTGIILDYNSDSDAESISATSYRGASSPGSDGSSSGHFHTSVVEILSLTIDSCKDIQTHAETIINRKTRESHFTKVKEGKSKAADASMDKKSSSSMVKTEKFITEEAMQRNRNNPPYIHLMNMIISFIILVAVIANIILVLLSVKT